MNHTDTVIKNGEVVVKEEAMLPTINPPGFFWPQTELGTDVKVSEWIRQNQRDEELKKENWDVVLFGVPLPGHQ